MGVVEVIIVKVVPMTKVYTAERKLYSRLVFNHVTERDGKKRDCKKMGLTSDGEATEPPLLLEGLSLADSGVAVNDNGVEDEAVLVALDLADHVGLGVGGAVVVDDTEATLQGHVDGHLVLGDSVHRRRDEGGLEGDALGDGGVEHHLGGREANVPRQQEEIIVGQTAVLGRVHELVQVQAIPHLVLLEHIERRGVVKHLGGGVDGCHCGRGLVFSEVEGVAAEEKV